MDQEAARTARESLDLAFHMSNILDTGLDRHTLSVLIALCDLGVNPEALAAVVRELHREPSAAAVPMPGPYEVRRPSLGPIPRAGSGTRSYDSATEGWVSQCSFFQGQIGCSWTNPSFLYANKDFCSSVSLFEEIVHLEDVA
ncbi:uncharacterized protein LOC104425382 isoform X1 [Eucalyptus grandis]|uniref:uncharacterized protein LOC104425382 isoform X1 n=1 Tax=Eucalyptus grandis TaxID=71139 RepID=UPI00192E7C82|nr:uncharacterized protein LOC104425382 isoform X1 [Eucalyptus grandis]